MDKFFYSLSRKFGKMGTFFNDLKVLLTFNPEKIAKRFLRKKTYQANFKGADSLSKKIIKWLKLK